ncbi:amidohydrolase [Planctomycetaceae bacterium SCGC AG-212-F19]|nr:amidohydrolase [Planctomycetaceae bacterium SCGC AG-212-F19]
MIDVHIHVVPPNLPGVGPLSPLLEGSPAKLAAALRKEMAQAGVTQAIAMGAVPAAARDPAGVRATLRLAQEVPGLHAVAAADPVRVDAAHLRGIDAALATRQAIAIKVYLGYLHFPPDHAGYRPYYELAERHRVPVIFHTGDTYSPRAKLRFAHPLGVDDVAVDHPNVRFVLAHLGHPWLLDAAEVIYKNVNVWADLSGLAVGGAGDFESEERQEALQETATAVRRAFLYAERPNRFLYGSDWPLVPMAFYRDFIRATLPEAHHQPIFHDNARSLFRI